MPLTCPRPGVEVYCGGAFELVRLSTNGLNRCVVGGPEVFFGSAALYRRFCFSVCGRNHRQTNARNKSGGQAPHSNMGKWHGFGQPNRDSESTKPDASCERRRAPKGRFHWRNGWHMASQRFKIREGEGRVGIESPSSRGKGDVAEPNEGQSRIGRAPSHRAKAKSPARPTWDRPLFNTSLCYGRWPRLLSKTQLPSGLQRTSWNWSRSQNRIGRTSSGHGSRPGR